MSYLYTQSEKFKVHNRCLDAYLLSKWTSLKEMLLLKALQAVSKSDMVQNTLKFIDGEGFDHMLNKSINLLKGMLIFGCIPFFIYLVFTFFHL
jgi:hypothetical protein